MHYLVFNTPKEEYKVSRKSFICWNTNPYLVPCCARTELFELYKGTGKSSEAVVFPAFYYGSEI